MTIARDRTALHRALAALALAAVGATTVAIVRGEPDLALTGDSGVALAVELAAAALAVAAAVATWRAGVLFPALLSAAALAWLTSEWNTPGAGAAFTIGLVLYAAWPPLLAAAALRGLDERQFDGPAALVVAVSLATGVGLLGLASAAVFDPDAQGCLECPTNLLLIEDAPGLGRTLGRVSLALTAAWAAAFAVLAAVRIARASPARRRWSAPVLLPAVLAVGLFGADALHGLDRGFVSNDPTDRALRLAEAGALALVAAGVALARWRARRTRAALARLVLDIGAAPAPGELRASRARLVAAADAKRRELERDLHDGAQQRLVAVALSIRLARRGIAADDPQLEARLAEAEEGVRAAVVQLRDVAHGLFPAVLGDEGLRAARSNAAAVREGPRRPVSVERPFLSKKTVDSHISQIFMKLGLRESPEDHRRVLAVLTFLRSGEP